MKIGGPRALTETPRPDAAQPATRAAATTPAADSFAAAPVREIPLAGPLTDPKVQVSGMAWHGDRLLLMPQFVQSLFVLERAEIAAHLDGTGEKTLSPRELPVNPQDFAARFPGFEGFEAIAIVGDRVFLVAEARVDGRMQGYLVAGRITPGGVELDLDRAHHLVADSTIANMGFESIVIAGDRLLVLPEVDGLTTNPRRIGHAFSLDLEPLGEVALPALDYRLTDSTPADGDGRFWVANYNHPGDPGMPEADRVEQLVPLLATADGVVSAGAPLPIELNRAEDSRNWEAVARFGDGFLVMSDEFPRAILGFVARTR